MNKLIHPTVLVAKNNSEKDELLWKVSQSFQNQNYEVKAWEISNNNFTVSFLKEIYSEHFHNRFFMDKKEIHLFVVDEKADDRSDEVEDFILNEWNLQKVIISVA